MDGCMDGLHRQDRTLDEVVAKAGELGQLERDMISGVVIKGGLVDEIARGRSMTFDHVLHFTRTIIERTIVRRDAEFCLSVLVC